MQKFNCTVEANSHHFYEVEVEAEDENEAKEKSWELYLDALDEDEIFIDEELWVEVEEVK